MNIAAKIRSSFWPLVSLAIAAHVAIPLIVLATNLGRSSDGTWQHLVDTVLTGYVVNTLLLAAGVGTFTLVLGVATAWLVTMCRFPTSRLLQWALLLPLAIPSYLLAYAATDLLQFAGPVQSWLRETFQWTKQDYWFPEIRSIPGAIVVLSLSLYPYVYLAARTAFIEQSVCALEASRTLGCGPWRSFFKVACPLARPSIVAGLSLVLMETLAEFGAVDHFAVDTFATGIYRTWMSRGSLVAAAQLSLCLLTAIMLLLVIESRARGQARYHHTTSRHRELTPIKLSLPSASIAGIVCWSPIAFGFILPAAVFCWMTIQNGDRRSVEMLVEFGTHSVTLATIAAMTAVVLSTLVAYAHRLHPTRIVGTACRVCGLGYAIPGTVIGIGVLGMAWGIENRLNDVAEASMNWSPGLFLSGTIAAVLLGYQTRFLAVSLGVIQAGLTRVRPSLDQAARTLGKTSGGTLLRVHIPLMRSSLLCAALLVFVDVLKELPATLILRPFNYDTLAVRVYQLASDERLDESSTAALAILVAGLLPVVVLSRLMSGRTGDRSLSQGDRP